MTDINDFQKEVLCEYKGEIYSVRDNGAILRHSKKGCRIRPLDNIWTFGKKNKQTGYMVFTANVHVHRIVASAFWGDHKKEGMVVDHRDTNRCNNRSENLHWVTRLENILNNPITRKKIIYICGSIAAFLKNPALLKDSSANPNFKWMRTVSKEEAAKCKANLDRWSQEDKEFAYISSNDGIDERIYYDDWPVRQNSRAPFVTPIPQIYKQGGIPLPLLLDSLTPNAMQENWKTPTEFPLCPTKAKSLEAYYSSLKIGKLFSNNIYGTNTIIESAISDDKKQICVATHNPDMQKQWAITYIYLPVG